MNENLTIFDVKQKSKEWLDLRKGYISASSVATALRMNGEEKYNEYITEKKSGVSNFHGNSATHFGELFEDIARSIFEHYTDFSVKEYGFIVNKKYNCLGVSPDGVLDNGDLLEIKCPYTRIIDGVIKNDYYHQIQLQGSVMESKNCYFLECKFKLEQSDTANFINTLDTSTVTGLINISGDSIGVLPWERKIINYGPIYYPGSISTINEENYFNYREPLSTIDYINKVNKFNCKYGTLWKYSLITISCQKVPIDPEWINHYYKRLQSVHDEINEDITECLFDFEENKLI